MEEVPSALAVRQVAQSLSSLTPAWAFTHASAVLSRGMMQLTDVVGQYFFISRKACRSYEEWKMRKHDTQHAFWKHAMSLLQRDRDAVTALQHSLLPRTATWCDFVASTSGLPIPNYANALYGWLRCMETSSHHNRYEHVDDDKLGTVSVASVLTSQGVNNPCSDTVIGSMLNDTLTNPYRWRYFERWDEDVADNPSPVLQRRIAILRQRIRREVSGAGRWHLIELLAALHKAPVVQKPGAPTVWYEWQALAALAHAMVQGDKALYQLVRDHFRERAYERIVLNTAEEADVPTSPSDAGDLSGAPEYSII